MISVLLLGFDGTGQRAVSAAEAVRTLAALVPATVDGVVRDLCLVGPDGDEVLADIADHAGCAFVPAPTFEQALASSARQLQCAHVLVAQAGMVIERAVIEELNGLFPALAEEETSYVLRAERRDLLGRLFPSLAPTAGLLCPRDWLLRAEATSLSRLAQRAKRPRIMRTAAWLST